MARYEVRTFADIVAAVREELGIGANDTTLINRIKRDINMVYREVAAEKDWWWLQGNTTLQLPAYISTGTVSVSQNSANIVFSSAPGPSQTGKYFSINGNSDIYKIESHAAGSVNAKLSEVYTGSTDTDATYKLWTDRIPLPTNCRETIAVWHGSNRKPLSAIGKQDYRRVVTANPKAEGKPSVYSTGDSVDPADLSSISSLPAVSTRASAGVVKTLVFASSLPADVVTAFNNGEPLRWKVSGANHPSYNGDILVSSISTTTNSNDTITYTGKAEHQESTISDSGITIYQIDQEAEYNRYRELFLYPFLTTTKILLHVDYVKEVFPLENDDDEPELPVEYRQLLVYGARSQGWVKARHPEVADRNTALFEKWLKKMAGKLQDTFDTPTLSPSKFYLSNKRSNVRNLRISETTFSGGGGGSGAQSVVTGAPDTVATFDGNGELVGSSLISLTELNHIDGLTAPAVGTTQAQTLTNKSIDADNNTISNIENDNIKTDAAIALNKLAATTVSRALVSDASGFVSPATTTATEIGYVNGVTSAIQTQLDAKTDKTTLSTTGDMYYASSANTPARLAIGAGTNQRLGVSGGIPAWQNEYLNISVKTGDYTATTADDVLLGNTNAITFTLPAATNTGKVLRFKKIGSDSNVITITRAGSDTIDGVVSTTLRSRYDEIALVADGTATWHVLDRRAPIAIRYKTAAGQSIPSASYTVVNFGTSEHDTHSAVTTGASWKFTVPADGAGFYKISVLIMFDSQAWTAGNQFILRLDKNGSGVTVLDQYQAEASTTDLKPLSGSTDLLLAAGDEIQISVYQANASARTLQANADYNHISISKIG
jgi:hypothetical protein